MKKILILCFTVFTWAAFAQVKISDMPAASTLNNADVFPVVQGGVNKKVPFSLFGIDKYSGTSPTTVTVGGLAAGTNISAYTLSQILSAIVAPYVAPVFTSFTITGQASIVEVGTTLSATRTFTWGITQNSATVNSIDVYDVTASNTILAATPNDGTQLVTISTIQLNSNGATQVWRGVGNITPSGTFNSSTFTITAWFKRYYGAASASPANSAAVKSLSSNAFHTGASTFTLATGNVEKKFVVALPPGVTISQVIDASALNADITAQYVLTGTMNVTDAGGTNRLYNIYEMNIASPYSTSHNHQITTAN